MHEFPAFLRRLGHIGTAFVDTVYDFPFASTCVVSTKSEGVYTYSSGCDSSVIFHLVSPTIIIISPRGYASFGLHVVLVLLLAFFVKSSATSFPPNPFRRCLRSSLLRAPHFILKRVHCIWSKGLSIWLRASYRWLYRWFFASVWLKSARWSR